MTIKRKTTVITRVEIVGDEQSLQKTLKDLYLDGFIITYSGPYTDAKLWPKVDPSRFEIIAEKVSHKSYASNMRNKSR